MLPLSGLAPVIRPAQETEHEPNQPGPIAGSLGEGQHARLSFKLSDVAPRDAQTPAKITGRVIDYHGVRYTVKLGDIVFKEIAVDEILDFVSPMELEEYETNAFEEEQKIMDVMDAAAEREELEELERRRLRAKTKGTVTWESVDEDIDSEATHPAATGKHGRARPDYKHLFKLPSQAAAESGKGFTASGQPRQRLKRRKRDPTTGELLPRSDDEDHVEIVDPSSGDDVPLAVDGGRDQKKRRRRKRDPITGELIELPPETEKPKPRLAPENYMHLDHRKRPRRRRHPVTGELMPLGWRYDPDAPAEEARSGSGGAQEVISPSMNRLSISQEQTAKRVKLGDGSYASTSDSGSATRTPTPPRVAPRPSIVELDGSEARYRHEEEAQAALRPFLKSPPINKALTGVDSDLHTKQALHSSPNTIMSILHSPPQMVADTESEEDEEWVIEAILDHGLSKPSTHGPDRGPEPVMLYKVQWEGGDETWEPIESFPDRSVIDDYHRERELELTRKTKATGSLSPVKAKASLPPVKAGKRGADQSSSSGSPGAVEPSQNVDPQEKASATRIEQDSSEGDQEEEYEVEAIKGHRWSDPRTHPPGVGKDPVMLYKVKWKGWEELSWEPINSFPEREMVYEYRRKVGLPRLGDHDSMMTDV